MFNLEKWERAIIIFLIAWLLLGFGVLAYKRSHPAIELRVKDFRVEDERTRSSDEAIEKSGKVNINEASMEGLTKLKGVGKVLAKRIIDYRAQNGPFDSVSDIKNVKGIGEKLFGEIKDKISIE